MTPKRPPTDDMTLHELGIADIDCAFDPDDFLDGPSVEETDEISDLELIEEDAPAINHELERPQ